MAWQPKDLMDVKREFVELAMQEGANRRELCRRFGIGAKAAYALLKRFAQEGPAAYRPRSRRPLTSPARTGLAMEQAVVALRQEHPAWGGRKIARRLADLGHTQVPPASTITAILHRHGLITVQASLDATPWLRFEHELPNALWQIDFKGDFALAQQRCYPLTLLDDHSRFNLALQACASVGAACVKPHLIRVFERYGMPVRINADNGAPWGSPRLAGHGLSELSVWLIRLGVRVSHSSPYHPQTNGKIERFHRSFKSEVLAGRSFSDLQEAQLAFERWRSVYNHERPHEALGMKSPDKRYQPSSRAYPNSLPEIEYPQGDTVAVVKHNGEVVVHGHKIKVPNSLLRMPIAFRSDPNRDGGLDVFFCHQRFMQLDTDYKTISN